MQRVPHLRFARGMHVTFGAALATGTAVASLFGINFGVISEANAQTYGSTYTSTAPRDCRVTSAGNGVDDSTIRVCPVELAAMR
jgi:hypothetical protein